MGLRTVGSVALAEPPATLCHIDGGGQRPCGPAERTRLRPAYTDGDCPEELNRRRGRISATMAPATSNVSVPASWIRETVSSSLRSRPLTAQTRRAFLWRHGRWGRNWLNWADCGNITPWLTWFGPRAWWWRGRGSRRPGRYRRLGRFRRLGAVRVIGH